MCTSYFILTLTSIEPLYNLMFNMDFFSSIFTEVPLCVQRPAKAMTSQQIIVHVLECPHDVDVHLLLLTLTSI